MKKSIKITVLSLILAMTFLNSQQLRAQWLLDPSVIGQVDAAAYSVAENNIVFFSANAVQHYALDTVVNEVAYDLTTIENMPQEVKAIDAAVIWDEENMLLFVGQDYLMYNLRESSIIETQAWSGLPAEWNENLDAVCYWDESNFMFFYANEYVLYDREKDTYSEVGLINNWEGWPRHWNRGFAAAVNIGNGIIYFFREKEYLSFDLETLTFDGPYPVTK